MTIGDSVTSIEQETFRGCTSLIKVTIGDSVTSIGEWAFQGCISLTEITIPKSVTNIDIEIFYLCENLKTINYIGTQEEWNFINFYPSWDGGMPSDYVINYNYVVQ